MEIEVWIKIEDAQTTILLLIFATLLSRLN